MATPQGAGFLSKCLGSLLRILPTSPLLYVCIIVLIYQADQLRVVYISHVSVSLLRNSNVLNWGYPPPKSKTLIQSQTQEISVFFYFPLNYKVHGTGRRRSLQSDEPTSLDNYDQKFHSGYGLFLSEDDPFDDDFGKEGFCIF